MSDDLVKKFLRAITGEDREEEEEKINCTPGGVDKYGNVIPCPTPKPKKAKK